MTKLPPDRLPDPIVMERQGRRALDDYDHPADDVDKQNDDLYDDLNKKDRG
jgi:hypothetical protein